MSVVFEGLGIGMFLPILQYIEAGGDIDGLKASSRLWEELVPLAASIGLNISLITLLVASFAMFVARQIFMYFRLLITETIKHDLLKAVRQSTFRRFLAADMEFHDRLKPGIFINELTTELDAAAGSLIAYVTFAALLVMIAVFFGWMLIFSTEMTLAVLVIFGIMAGALWGLVQQS